MRAIAADRRLEAIAGPPVEYTTVPILFPNLGHQRTGIAVGVYEPSGETQILLSPTGVQGDPPEWVSTSSYTHGVTAGVWWVYRPFGVASALSRWEGPCIAVSYDRVLTDTTALAVVRYLSLSLSHTHTHTHTHS